MMQSISQLAALTGMAKETISKRLNAAGLEFTPGPKAAKLFESPVALPAIYETAAGGDQGDYYTPDRVETDDPPP